MLLDGERLRAAGLAGRRPFGVPPANCGARRPRAHGGGAAERRQRRCAGPGRRAGSAAAARRAEDERALQDDRRPARRRRDVPRRPTSRRCSTSISTSCATRCRPARRLATRSSRTSARCASKDRSTPTPAKDSPSRRKIFVCTPTERGRRDGLRAQDRHATWRRTRSAARPPPADVDLLMEFYTAGRKERRLRRRHRDGAGARPGVAEVHLPHRGRAGDGRRPARPYRISDLDLASRLSFFLWSTAPGRRAAAASPARAGCKDPAVLEQQVRRMLKDPRAEALADQLRRPVAEPARAAERRSRCR